MCEIYPEVPNCCLIFSLRMGMLFISVLSIISGCITLSIIEQQSNASFGSLRNISDIRNTKQAVSHLSGLINTGIGGMSVMFMFAGLMLLVATFTDQEGIAQAYVWITCLSLIIGFFLIFLIAMECLFKDVCALSNLDWLSAAATLVGMVFYLLLWFYFICVANSYVLNG